MILGWNLADKLLMALNSDSDDFSDDRYPIIRAQINLVYFKGDNHPTFLADFYRLAMCTNDLKVTKEDTQLMEKMRKEVLIELIPTLGESFYFRDEYSEETKGKVYKFVDNGEVRFRPIFKYEILDTDKEVE